MPNCFKGFFKSFQYEKKAHVNKFQVPTEANPEYY